MDPNTQPRDQTWIRWLPQRGAFSSLYLPEHPLPPGETEALGFEFSLTDLATSQQNHSFHRPFLLYAINAYDDVASGFMLQLWHQFAGGTRRFYQRHVNGASAAGTGSLPHIFRHPYLLDVGDSLTMEAKNLDRSAATSHIFLALFGVVIDDPAVTDAS